MKTTTRLGLAALGLPIIGGAALGCTALREVRQFVLRSATVPVLPQDHKPLTILHISDLHLLPHQDKKIAWVRSLANVRPDFVVNTGDCVASPHALPALARALEPLEGTPGVFVNGSNDFYGPAPRNPLQYLHAHQRRVDPTLLPTGALWSLLESMGWQKAEEVRLRYTLSDTTIEVRGCGDAHIDRDYYPSIAGEVDSDVDLLLGVTHAPYIRVLDQMVADGCNLILAGHTHGGQVCWPNGHALTTNCDLPTQLAKGLAVWVSDAGEAWLHVSAGLGTSPYAPYRLFCPPEATLLTLIPE